MEVERVFVARAIAPLKKDPPAICQRDKTITFDTFQTKLYFFPDNRPEALEYAREVLPTLLPPPNPPEAGLTFYRQMKDKYLEFDFTTNTLSLCSVKKTKA